MDFTQFLSKEIIEIGAFIAFFAATVVPIYADLKKTSSIEKMLDKKSSQVSVNSKASQESVNSIKDELKRVSSQESVNTLIREKASQESVNTLIREKASQVSVNAQFTNLEKDIARNHDEIHRYLENIQSAKVDSGSIQDSVATLLSVVEKNGQLIQKINDIEKELEESKQLNMSLEEKIKIFKTHIQNIEKENKQLKIELSKQATKQNDRTNKTHDEHDDYEIEM